MHLTLNMQIIVKKPLIYLYICINLCLIEAKTNSCNEKIRFRGNLIFSRISGDDSKTDEFFRSLFIDVAQNENLNNLKDCFESKFNINSPKYCPHISLFYGIEDDATKNDIIRKLKVPKSAIMDKISIVKVDEEIKSWEVLKSYSLFKLKQ